MRVVAVGDCGVDRYVDVGVDRPGGITLNFAVNARACFPPIDDIQVVTAVGSDPEAGVVLEALDSHALRASVARLDGRTPVQYLERDAAGERRFLRYDEGVLADHRLDASDRDLVAAADVVVTNVFRQVEGFFDALMAVPVRGTRFVDFLDLADWDDGVGFVRRYADRLDVAQFGLRPDQHDLIDRLESVARESASVFVVTLGSAGCVGLGGARRVHCRAEPVSTVVDTTGAGDAFAAGFLSCYCRSSDLAESLRRGSRRAAATLGRLGAF